MMFARLLPAGIWERHVYPFIIILLFFLVIALSSVAELNVQVFSVKGSVFRTPAILRHGHVGSFPPWRG